MSAALIFRSGDPAAVQGAATRRHLEVDADQWVTGAITKASVSGGAMSQTAWQNPTWGTNWATAGTLNGMSTFRGLQCRYTAEDEVWVLGAAATTGTSPTICTLPAGYWPKTNQRVLLPAYYNQGGVKPGFVQVTETGAVSCTPSLSGVTVTSGTQVFINGKVPLGNLP